MKMIVGLGNPTAQYIATRHNIGFAVIDQLSEQYNIGMTEKKHKAIYGKGVIAGEKILLVKPQTYMNLSGESVRELVDYYKVSNEDIVIIYDDIDLAVGHLRLRAKGSAGGHNGIKNIIAQLGTQEFARIRVGVGEKPKGYDLADYVLGHFSKGEIPVIREGIANAAAAVTIIIEENIDAAMNRFNVKKQ